MNSNEIGKRGAGQSSVSGHLDLPPTFPLAAQPDIVRATQKDDLYIQQFTDACHDAVRHVLGPRRALLWARETEMLAQLMYYGLTTGAGIQTLGEEYCEILQASGNVGVTPGVFRRGILVLLQSLGPYCLQQLGVPTDAASAPSETTAFDDVPFAPSQPQHDYQTLHDQSLVTTWTPIIQRLQWCWRLAISAAKQWAGPAIRFHLALFYLHGLFYHAAKRFTGVRYIFAGRLLERRPSYSILGILLFLQLSLSAGGWALQRFASRPRPVSNAEADASGNGGGAQAMPAQHSGRSTKQGPPVVLEQDDRADGEQWRRLPPTKQYISIGGEIPGGRRCPLCLSARDHPTATPCGHVFCWRCIAEWGAQKPECPLCRSAFTNSTLIVLAHTDF